MPDSALARSFATIIVGYRRNSISTCFFLALIQLLQDLALVEIAKPLNYDQPASWLLQNLLFTSNLTSVIRLSESFCWGIVFACCILQLICIGKVVLAGNNTNRFVAVAVQWSVVVCPIAMAVAARLTLANSKSSSYYLLLLIIAVFGGLWGVRVSILRENYTHLFVPLGRSVCILRPLQHLVLNYMITLQVDPRAFLLISLVVSCTDVVLCLTTFRNLSEQVQYAGLLGRVLFLIVTLARLMELLLTPNRPPSLSLLCTCILLFLLIERTNVLQRIFEYKYKKLFENYQHLENLSEIIVFINLLNEKIYLRRKIIWFSFYERISETEEALRRITKDGQTCPEETANQSIERVLGSKCTKKGLADLKLFLAYESIEKQELFRSAIYLNGLEHLSLPEKVDSLVLLEQIKHGSVSYSGSSNNRDSQVTCIHRKVGSRYNQSIAQHVFQSQLLLSDFAGKLTKLSIANSALARKLNSLQLPSSELCWLLIDLARNKKSIQKFVQQHHKENLRNRQFLVLYYIYLALYCSRKYTLSEVLCSFLQVEPDSDINRLSELFQEGQVMNVVVSAQEEFLGCIVQADKRMIEFAGLSQQRIRQHFQTINPLLPSFIKSAHSDIMRNYLVTGVSHFIGQSNVTYMVRGEQLHQIQVLIKLFPNVQGIMFGCCLKLLNTDCLSALFQPSGQLQQRTSQFISGAMTLQKCFPSMDLRNIQKKYYLTYQHVHYSVEMSKYKRERYEYGVCTLKEIGRADDFDVATYGLIVAVQEGKYIDPYRSISAVVEDLHQSNLRQLYKGNLQAERRVHSISANDKKLLPLNILICLLVIGSFLAVGFITNRVQSINSECNTIMQFEYALYNGFKLRNFEMSKRFALYHAINNNQFPNNRGAKYNVTDLRSYLLKKQVSYLSKLEVYDGNLIRFSKVLPLQYAQIIRDNELPYWMQTGWRKSTFTSIVSSLKSFYAQVTAYNMTQFEQQWPSIYKYSYYFTNNLAVELNNQIFNPVLMANEKYINDKAQIVNLEQMGWCTALILVSLGVLGAWWRAESHKLTYLSILRQCTEGVLAARLSINEYGESLLKAIPTYCISGFKLNLDQETRIGMRCHGKTHGFFLNMNPQINDYPRGEEKGSSRRDNKKVLDRSTTVRTLVLFLVVLVCNTLFVGQFMLKSRDIHSSNVAALDFFNKFSEGGSQVRMNLAAVLNTVVYLLFAYRATILKSDQKYFYMLPSTQYLKQGQANIYNRNFQNFLTGYNVDWAAIRGFVYASQCAPTDKLCKTVIQGAIDQGFTPAFIIFTTKAVNLYNQLNAGINTTSQVDDAYELILTYQLYLRTILSSCLQYGLNITTAVVTTNSQDMILSLWQRVIPLQVIGALMLICYVVYVRISLHMIKRQVLAFVEIDILTQRLLRYNQVYQLSD